MSVITAEQILTDDVPLQTATLGYLPDGVSGVIATLRQMKKWAREYRRNPEIRAFAEDLIRGVPEKDAVGEVRAVFEWVRDNIRYTQDIRDVETIKSPDAVIYSGMGDCDDKALLVSTLLETIGFPTRFVAVALNEPGVFEHVYTEVKLGTVWITLDSIMPYPMGWKPSGVLSQLVRDV